MKKFSDKEKSLMIKNKLINEYMLDDFLKFYNSYDFNNPGRFVRYISTIKNLNDWDNNYIKFNDYAIKNYKQFIGTYDAMYVSLQKNISLDEATKIITDMRPINTLSEFIRKYGEIIGLEKYESFKKASISRSKDQCSEYELKSSSVWCKEFYIKRGYSEEDSIIMAKLFNKNNAGANKHYWINKGYSDEEIIEILKPINKRKAGGKKHYKKLYGDNWQEKWNERVNKYRKTINAVELIDEFKKYHRKCMLHTHNTIIFYGDYIENLHLRGKIHDYHLDHVFSIKEGFLNDIDPQIIAHVTNLKNIKSFDNCSKGSKCDKTIDQLFEDINKFNEEKKLK
jgi:hypothetical protein